MRERKLILIMAMDFNDIAFWRLCEEKDNRTSEVYKSFLQTYFPQWMTGNRHKGQGFVHYDARLHKSRGFTKYLLENKFDTRGY